MSEGNEQPIAFDEVVRGESDYISKSRVTRLGDNQTDESHLPQQMVGLALSGGGVRSATFSLGVLQGLASFGLLRRLDYLSSTGGGSHIAGWLLRWIAARGYHDVEKQLSGQTSNTIEAAEIQGLRQATAFHEGRGLSSGSIAVLTWVRNVAMNLLSLTTALAAAVLLTKLALEKVFFLQFSTFTYAALAVGAAFLLWILSRSSEKPALSPPTQLRTLSIALVLIVFAVVLLRAGNSDLIAAPNLDWYVISGLAMTCFCFILGFPHRLAWKILVAHVAAAVAVGAAGGVLLFLVNKTGLWPPHLFYLDLPVSYQPPYYQESIQVAWPLAVFAEVVSLLLYALLLKRWFSRRVRELFWRLCRTLAGLATLWLLVILLWYSDPVRIYPWLVVVTLLTCGGFFKVVGIPTKSRVSKFLFDLLERFAPYAFVIGQTAIVGTLLLPVSQPGDFQDRIRVLVVAVLALISLVLLWLIRARGLTMHRFHRSRIVRNYLVPAGGGAQPTGTDDMSLNSLVSSDGHTGPYPLFGAALEVAEVSASGGSQRRTVPFLFAPLFSGLDLPRTQSGAYRPTHALGGGFSLATAMAISQPRWANAPPAGSPAAAMFWTIFDMRNGRFTGNPLRNDSWRERSPLIESVYALREGVGDLPTEATFVRPIPGEEFDNLGIYQLVKRRCRFIIACDATEDPDFSFEDLGATILKCRTELGVEIQMDLGPLGRTPASSGAHCQIAQIRYGKGEDGLMIYIKPSLTGDEPTGLVQYARVHPEFPAKDIADGRFGESDFENYRGLGQHIVGSLLSDLSINPEMPTGQVFRLIRRLLQPDFKEPETAGTPDTEEAKAALPEELVEALASGECVLCAGSGLAAQAKLPTWSAFLDGLLRTARDNGSLDAASATGLSATLAAGEFEAMADELTHQIPRDLLLEYVRSATAASEPSVAHTVLAEMKFLGALNTNMDNLLGRAFQSRILVPAEADRLVATLQSKKFFVANLFGSASEPSSLLFSMKEFRLLLSANTQFKQFLGTLFLRYTIVFVGLGIDGLRDYLEALELPQTPERKHFAIIPNSGQIDPVKLRFLERSYNVSVVDYQPQFNYTGLPAFLKQLQSAVNAKAPPTKAAGALILKSVALENIGPFHSLQIDFTPTWNLLLGDNGVGKTVILKAIAAALCGERADARAVTRLLRAGATKGAIRLKDENREYTVELERRVDGSIHVVSASLSPIIYERWLALGFPALRSIPLVNPKGPSIPNMGAPSAEDLLPILLGEPDDRIADIKQWLVNLDYAAKSEPSPSRSARLFRDFFKVLQSLMPDLHIEPGPINRKTMEISVKTDSGVVPLEALSQGTGSVMCWIGTLLERLSETGNARNAERNTALVLIDELDAHMHPKWQQMFVDGFRREFKSVQIIATTHSPLLVGSLKPEEIWLVRRAPLKSEIYGLVKLQEGPDGMREILVLGPEKDEDQPSVPREEKRYVVSATETLVVKDGESVEQGEALTKGDVRVEAERIRTKDASWRADQILTSPLFELETTRDPETARMLSEYTSLSALDNPSETEHQKLAELAADLQIRLPTPGETETARIAYDLIHKFASQSVSALPKDQQAAVLAEVKTQLTESITGSRRPE